MRIQHNIMAMGAYRNYTNNLSAMKKNLEKLSSGYKINRAGDDAAGLAISEKMRAQITGLETAQKNAKDGISLVQTAEGALTEVHDMLNRMVELATQSANGTYDDTTDRFQLQKEMDQLRSEINRIADSSNFNGINLLDGSLSSKGAQVASGMDRMLEETAEKDDLPGTVAGTKTILQGSGATQQKAQFTVDLTQLNVTVKKDGTTDQTAELTVKVGSVDFTATLSSTQTKGYAAKDITAAGVLKDPGGNNLAKGSIVTFGTDSEGNDIQYKVTEYGSGKITFESVNNPTLPEHCKPDYQVTTTIDDETLVSNFDSVTNGVTVKQEGVTATGAALANTTFEIKESDIVDGTVITLNGTSVTLAVGQDSKYLKANNVVDLSMMEEGEIDLDLALSKINGVFKGNTKDFIVGVSDGTNGQPKGITVQQKNSAAAKFINGTNKDDGLKYDTREKLGAEFAINAHGSALTLQIGDTADDFNQLKVDIQDTHCTSLGISDISIATQEDAAKAVDAIKKAINYVSDVRGTLGATQNRLDHTINNLSVMTENIQDAESTIRDTDVAEEMMAYTKNNILIQSAQAMLAQANQVPQGVLQLLQ